MRDYESVNIACEGEVNIEAWLWGLESNITTCDRGCIWAYYNDIWKLLETCVGFAFQYMCGWWQSMCVVLLCDWMSNSLKACLWLFRVWWSDVWAIWQGSCEQSGHNWHVVKYKIKRCHNLNLSKEHGGVKSWSVTSGTHVRGGTS